MFEIFSNLSYYLYESYYSDKRDIAKHTIFSHMAAILLLTVSGDILLELLSLDGGAMTPLRVEPRRL
ncbi:hypothetical protein DPMN_070856 [Dreissena polymorpha]|uniref:Uncharacterized protein n=1 Tax=Dreissena polymorpha TaxID=45954 RepID=A0A9D3Z617_DREPO|nr:hypothetical protein DPMN_070856 [Dreissena polymorpha]